MTEYEIRRQGLEDSYRLCVLRQLKWIKMTLLIINAALAWLVWASIVHAQTPELSPAESGSALTAARPETRFYRVRRRR